MMLIMRQLRPAILAFSTYVFPIVATPLLTWIWWRIAGGNWLLVSLVLLVPVLFGYVVVWIASNVKKRWRMTSGWRIGGAYVHHGFIYASKMAFVLLLATRDPMAIRTWDLVALALLVGSATAFGGWFHDLHAIRAGKIELIGLGPRAAEAALASFAPPTYFAIGATYAVVAVIGWQHVVVHPNSFVLVFLGALAALLIVPSLVYFALSNSDGKH